MNEIDCWVEVTVPCASESKEAVENFLFDHGSCGLEEGSGEVKGYFPGDCALAGIRISLDVYLQALRRMGFSVGEPVFRTVPREDWNVRWRDRFRPVRVTSRIVVKPPWERWRSSPGQVVVDIMPRMAFGTGTHETTQLCLQLLESYLKPSNTILDVGTGSGVLAVVAAKLGADRVLAVDTDDEAVRNAQENVALNGVTDRVEVLSGSLESVGSRTFDVILANIDRSTLMRLLSEFKEYLVSGGRLILSGILNSEKAALENGFSSWGYRLLEDKVRGEWSASVVEPW